jgi:hypothetical protein
MTDVAKTDYVLYIAYIFELVMNRSLVIFRTVRKIEGTTNIEAKHHN